MTAEPEPETFLALLSESDRKALLAIGGLRRFDGGEHPVYLIYGYKRGTFWPFIPIGDGQKRDNAGELRLKNDLEDELPFEEDLTRWMGLFGAPL